VPLFHVQVAAQGLDVGNQMLCGVGFEASDWLRATCAALIKENYAVDLGVKETGVSFGRASSRPTMKVYN
jgi:hypothetical protein